MVGLSDGSHVAGVGLATRYQQGVQRSMSNRVYELIEFSVRRDESLHYVVIRSMGM